MAHDFPKESLVCYTFASAAGGRDGRISFLFGKAGRRWNFLPAEGQEVFSRIAFWIPAEIRTVRRRRGQEMLMTAADPDRDGVCTATGTGAAQTRSEGIPALVPPQRHTGTETGKRAFPDRNRPAACQETRRTGSGLIFQANCRGLSEIPVISPPDGVTVRDAIGLQGAVICAFSLFPAGCCQI